MDHHLDASLHAQCVPKHHGSNRSAEPLEDSVWRGGEAVKRRAAAWISFASVNLPIRAGGRSERGPT